MDRIDGPNKRPKAGEEGGGGGSAQHLLLSSPASIPILPPPPPIVLPLDVSSLPSVDVLVPAHNAASTLRETLSSALSQCYAGAITLCVYDDGSADATAEILESYEAQRLDPLNPGSPLAGRYGGARFFRRGGGAAARGAGYARNRCAALGSGSLLCLLDSDDVCSTDRVARQVACMLALGEGGERDSVILGTRFVREPEGATWHYSEWANSLTNERLLLERYREVTIIQPTWMLTRKRFMDLGGYLECDCSEGEGDAERESAETPLLPPHSHLRFGFPPPSPAPLKLFDASEPVSSLRLCEDLRFFHAHLSIPSGSFPPLLSLVQTPHPLLTYRHSSTLSSQSSRTSRKLLLQLRLRAFESNVLNEPPFSGGFAVWGAGRDGKDFVKCLKPELLQNVKCMVDVDENKINAKFYFNPEVPIKVPIRHFEDLKEGKEFGHLPVVVCVAMYRTGGKLEENVASICRTEGANLWHFF